MAFHGDPSKKLKVEDKDAPKVLFLSVNPEHQKHEIDDMIGGPTSQCTICRLVDKFKESIILKSLKVLQRELKVKTLKLCQRDVTPNLEVSTLESNFADQDDELDKDDTELLIFSEVLEQLKIPIPQVLQSKLQIVLRQKKIPVRQNKAAATEEEKKNTFLACTNNKKLSEIGDKLTAEEVYAIKEFTLQQKEDDVAVVKMAEALSVIDDPESLKTIPGFKDVVFYYIILNLFKQSLLNRLYTHTFEYLLKGARDSLPEPEKRVHIQDALSQLMRYPLTARPPGICIIFAMTIDRCGAGKDVQEVRKIFEQEFNYDVFEKLNPKVKDIKTLVAKLSAPRNMFYDSLVVWFMGHGDKTYLKVKDGEIHRRSELLQPFVDIDWLKNKPKLFFIQACANKREESGLSVPGGPGLRTEKDGLSLGINASEEWKKMYAQHTDAGVSNSLANTLVSYATMWYQPASRGKTGEGSLFIHTLLDCLKHHGRTTSIENVLRRVHYKVHMVCLNDDNTIWKQSPYYESSLQKEFILP